MTNMAELFATVDLNDLDQIETLISRAYRKAALGAAPKDMSAWVAREFVKRRQSAIHGFLSSTGEGHPFPFPESIHPDERAAINAILQKQLDLAAKKMDTVHSGALLSLVIDFYYALHPRAPGAGQWKAA